MSSNYHAMNEFGGSFVVVFEARMAGVLADLVAKHGGIPVSAPALREIPIDGNPAVVSFIEGLKSRQFDSVLFETGVGIRYLIEASASLVPVADWPALLGQVTVIARGPKPATALRSLGAKIDFQVPAPNTWRETLALIDGQIEIDAKRIAVQEYGKPNQELLDGLEKRGAFVTRVPVYRWALPEDTGPLRSAIGKIIDGEIGSVLFTAAQQVEHLFQVANQDQLESRLREALTRTVVVGSVGPVTTESLKSHGLPVDIEPDHPKSGQLVAAVAKGWRDCGKTRE